MAQVMVFYKQLVKSTSDDFYVVSRSDMQRESENYSVVGLELVVLGLRSRSFFAIALFVVFFHPIIGT